MNNYRYYPQAGYPYERYGDRMEQAYYEPHGYPYATPENNAGMFLPPQTPYDQFEKPPLSSYWENEMPNIPSPMKPASTVKGYFQDENGQLDIDKMLSTVGQAANTYHQVYPIFKQIGDVIKNFNQR